MKQVLNRLNRRLQLAAIIAGGLAFAAMALIFGATFKSQTHYSLLQDILAPIGEDRYDLTWTLPEAPVIGRFGPDENSVYGRLLVSFLSGRLERLEPARVEVNLAQRSGQTDNTTPRTLSIRVRSQAAPALILENNSLASFHLETDALVIELNSTNDEIVQWQLQTQYEAIRIANTRLGLAVRHIEATRAPLPLRAVSTAGHDQKLAGFNYYPASAPWDLFWRDFPVTDIRADFERIQSSGGNSVRIFLNQSAFAAPETRARSLDRLVQLLDIAEENDLRVILTCFDLGRGYTLQGLAEDWAHLKSILDVASTHSAAALIDLKNEPDLDFENWGTARVEAWLSTLATLSKTHYPDLPITIGWSNAEDAARLTALVDVVSFHDYEPASGLSGRIERLKGAASGKPVMLTEIGHTKWGINPFRRSQSKAYAEQLEQIGQLDGVLVWTLNDFDQVPSTVAGWRPWRKAMQANFGLEADSLTLVSTSFRAFLSGPDQTL